MKQRRITDAERARVQQILDAEQTPTSSTGPVKARLPVTDPAEPDTVLDVHRPHAARVYNFWLGGKDNFEADRMVAQEMANRLPSLVRTARANRAFMTRVTRYLAGELGIRQFLDIGTGLPSPEPNLHQVAQRIAPQSKVVYVDNDPLVLVHARALLTSAPEGETSYIEADARAPDKIFGDAGFILDTGQPVAVTLIAILQLIEDDTEVHRILAELMARLCPGSVLALSVITPDTNPEQVNAAAQAAQAQGIPVTPRTRAQAEAMFSGLRLLDPGVVLAHRWRPDPDDPPLPDHEVHVYGGVAIKP